MKIGDRRNLLGELIEERESKDYIVFSQQVLKRKTVKIVIY